MDQGHFIKFCLEFHIYIENAGEFSYNVFRSMCLFCILLHLVSNRFKKSFSYFLSQCLNDFKPFKRNKTKENSNHCFTLSYDGKF